MANEAENNIVKPAAEHTDAVLSPQVEASGVEVKNETDEYKKLHSAATELGGNAHGEITHFQTAVSGSLDHSQFEEPKPNTKLRVDDTRRYDSFTSLIRSVRAKRKGLKNAA